MVGCSDLEKNNNVMAKYVLKESELYSVLSEIITEELSNALDEGFIGNVFKGAGRLAGNGLVAALNPGGAVKSVYDYMLNPNKTIVGTVRDTLRSNGTTNKNTQTGKSTKPKTRQEKAQEKTRSLNRLKYNYGEPETDVVFGGRRKLRKERIIVNNFLGTNEDKDFGTHYVEKNQNSDNSFWSRKLREAEEEVNTNRNPRRAIRVVTRELNDWLKERDEAYRNDWKTIK